MSELTKQDRQVVEVQHLAGELYDLLRTQGPGAAMPRDAQARQVRELADTLLNKMAALGPMRNERGAFFKALPANRVIEHTETEPATRYFHNLNEAAGTVGNAGWLYALSSAVPCFTNEYLDARQKANAAILATDGRGNQGVEQAEVRQPEPALTREVDIIVKALPAPPVAEVMVTNDMLEAFKRAVSWLGGRIESSRPSSFTEPIDPSLAFYTVSGLDGAGLFSLGRMMVLDHLSEKEGGPTA